MVALPTSAPEGPVGDLMAAQQRVAKKIPAGRAGIARELPPNGLGDPTYSRTADAIRQDIMDGTFADGERLLTLDLAKRYGLSLAPIREALHQLSAEGIVVTQPKRGTVVRAITPAFIGEIYEIRLGLIPYLEGERAALAQPEHIETLTRIQAAYEAAVAAGSREGVIARNIEFHNAALAIRPNREALQILKRHHTLIRALRLKRGFGSNRLQRAIKEHRQLVDAYRRRSVEDAQTVSRLHLKHAYEELIDLFNAAR
jgi:DNA-binding GntR family transcriptional regulator